MTSAGLQKAFEEADKDYEKVGLRATVEVTEVSDASLDGLRIVASSTVDLPKATPVRAHLDPEGPEQMWLVLLVRF